MVLRLLSKKVTPISVTPIFNKGDVSVLTNYHPISVTPTFANVFERLLHNQLVKKLEKFALLNKNQFGFQSGKSSTDAVLYFIEKIIGTMEDNNDTGAVFLDLANAFSSISQLNFLRPIRLLTDYLKAFQKHLRKLVLQKLDDN